MLATLKTESTLTDRYQTTVPETVRRALHLGKRDKILYTIRPNGEVVLTHAGSMENEDPLLGQFLAFLASDIANHPDSLYSVNTKLVQHIQSLTSGVKVDLDEPLQDADE
jgi:antitoxin PrlF